MPLPVPRRDPLKTWHAEDNGPYEMGDHLTSDLTSEGTILLSSIAGCQFWFPGFRLSEVTNLSWWLQAVAGQRIRSASFYEYIAQDKNWQSGYVKNT